MTRSLIKNLFLAGTLSLSLFGCGKVETTRGVFEGFAFEFNQGSGIYGHYLELYSNEKCGGKIYFQDTNKDGRADKVDLYNVRKGDPVEQYATIETWQKISAIVEDKKD